MEDKKIKKMITDGEIEKVPRSTLMAYLENRDQIQGLPTNAIKFLIYEGMADKVPTEDLILMEENMEARKNFVGEGIDNLYKSVCLQAVEDYKEVRHEMTSRLMSRSVQESIEERKKTLEKFFATEFFLKNSGCPSADYVIKQIERQIKARAQACMVR